MVSKCVCVKFLVLLVADYDFFAQFKVLLMSHVPREPYFEIYDQEIHYMYLCTQVKRLCTTIINVLYLINTVPTVSITVLSP